MPLKTAFRLTAIDLMPVQGYIFVLDILVINKTAEAVKRARHPSIVHNYSILRISAENPFYG